MQSSFKIGRIAGIDVGIHYTWLIAFALITWTLAVGFFPAAAPGLDATTYWVMGGVAALALFASVLIHELSHSLVALARGLKVDSITLFIFGGVANIEGEAESPLDEFLIAVVGPITSLVLAGLFWLASQALGGGQSVAAVVLSYLFLINVILAIFNLIPGFPLDGGRVLRSIIWGVTGSLRRATQIASYVGQGFGFLLIFWGVWQLFAGNFLGGLWTAFIGWFLNNAAEQARQQQVLQAQLGGVRVGEVMDPQPAMVPPTLTVDEMVYEQMVRRGRRALLVMDGSNLLGIVTITDARELPQEQWPTTRVADIMTPTPLKTVSPETDLTGAVRQMAEGDLNQMPVLRNGQVIGILSRVDIMRFLRMSDELGLRRRSGRMTARSHVIADEGTRV